MKNNEGNRVHFYLRAFSDERASSRELVCMTGFQYTRA